MKHCIHCKNSEWKYNNTELYCPIKNKVMLNVELIGMLEDVSCEQYVEDKNKIQKVFSINRSMIIKAYILVILFIITMLIIL